MKEKPKIQLSDNMLANICTMSPYLNEQQQREVLILIVGLLGDADLAGQAARAG